jgi:hypothetical protein
LDPFLALIRQAKRYFVKFCVKTPTTSRCNCRGTLARLLCGCWAAYTSFTCEGGLREVSRCKFATMPGPVHIKASSAQQQSNQLTHGLLLSPRSEDMHSSEKRHDMPIHIGLPPSVASYGRKHTAGYRSILTAISLTGCLIAVSLMAVPLWVLWTNGLFSQGTWKDALVANARPSADRQAFPTE